MTIYLPKFLYKNSLNDVSLITLSDSDSTANKTRLIDRNDEVQTVMAGTSGTMLYTPTLPVLYDSFFMQNINWDTFSLKVDNGLSRYDAYTKLLLQLNADFTDSSNSTKTVTNNGTGSISATSKFGAGSYRKTNATHFLSVPYNTYWNLNNSFTIDFWIRLDDVSNNGGIVGCGSVSNGWSLTYNGSNQFDFTVEDNSVPYTLCSANGFTLSNDTWFHLELSFDGTNYRFFINGQDKTSASTTHAIPVLSSVLTIGKSYFSGAYSAYIDEFRFSYGIARHTSNFTPEVAAYAPTTSGIVFPTFPAVSGNTSNNIFAVLNQLDITPTNYLITISSLQSGENSAKIGELYLGNEIFEVATETGGSVSIMPKTKQFINELSDGTSQKLYLRKLRDYQFTVETASTEERNNLLSVYVENKRNPFVFIPQPADNADTWDGIGGHVNWVSPFDCDNRVGNLLINGYYGTIDMQQAGGIN